MQADFRRILTQANRANGAAAGAIGLPFFPAITREQIAEVCGCAERALAAR